MCPTLHRPRRLQGLPLAEEEGPPDMDIAMGYLAVTHWVSRLSTESNSVMGWQNSQGYSIPGELPRWKRSEHTKQEEAERATELQATALRGRTAEASLTTSSRTVEESAQTRGRASEHSTPVAETQAELSPIAQLKADIVWEVEPDNKETKNKKRESSGPPRRGPSPNDDPSRNMRVENREGDLAKK